MDVSTITTEIQKAKLEGNVDNGRLELAYLNQVEYVLKKVKSKYQDQTGVYKKTDGSKRSE